MKAGELSMQKWPTSHTKNLFYCHGQKNAGGHGGHYAKLLQQACFVIKKAEDGCWRHFFKQPGKNGIAGHFAGADDVQQNTIVQMEAFA